MAIHAFVLHIDELERIQQDLFKRLLSVNQKNRDVGLHTPGDAHVAWSPLGRRGRVLRLECRVERQPEIGVYAPNTLQDTLGAEPIVYSLQGNSCNKAFLINIGTHRDKPLVSFRPSANQFNDVGEHP